uniref:DUF397 domain-containing protein n=1 Tax=Streptomyces sp. F12 TaxID=1436084 RepID=V9Z777_9ACTN|nr:hypothetical protein pFRL6_295 [Streptomyces sp. F12]
MQITDDGLVAARDSKVPERGAFVFSAAPWGAFVHDVKSGRLG